MIELRVLGTLDLVDRVHGNQLASVLAQPKRIALLCYLALASPRGAQRRETLLALFWPEASEEKARNSLNQAVFQLRRSLGDAAILSTAEAVGLRSGIWCDALAFDEALAARQPERALELYGGHLLPGFHLDGSVEFEQWLDAERERLRRRAVAAALASAEVLAEGGNPVGAIEWLRRAVVWAPYDEGALARLVARLDQVGDRAGALQAYDRFRDLMATELGLEPSAELVKLAHEIRSRTGAPASPDRPEPLAEAPPSVAPPLVTRGESAAAGLTRSTTPPRTTRLRWPSGSRRAWIGATTLLLAAALMTSSVVRAIRTSPEQAPPLPAPGGTVHPRGVLVAAFANRTGDATLDPLAYMAADWITHGLSSAGLPRVVPFSTVVQETPFLAQGVVADEGLQMAQRELARRSGAALLVSGSYYRSGSDVLLQAQVVDVASGEILRSMQPVRGAVHEPAESVAELQRRTVAAIAGLFDERLRSWPDPGARPTSLEAYHLFTEGMALFTRGNQAWGTPDGVRQNREAADRFLRAAHLDSAFTTALLWAGYSLLGIRDSTAVHSILQSIEQRPLPVWSRAVVNHQWAGLSGDAERQYHAARELAALSPDTEWLFALALGAHQTGRHRTALDAFLRIDPDRGWIRGLGSYWRLRTELQHVLGHFEAALDDARRGLDYDPGDSWLQTQELWALAALGRADEILDRTAPKLAANDLFALWQLTTVLEELVGHEQQQALASLLERSIPMVEALVARLPYPPPRGQLAYLLAMAGRTEEAAAIYRSLVTDTPAAAEYRIRLATLSARAGDAAPAESTLEWLRGLNDSALEHVYHPSQQPYWGSPEGWVALGQARLLAQMGRRDEAAEVLRGAARLGLAHTYLHLHDDPDFATLRNHPVVQALLRSRD